MAKDFESLPHTADIKIRVFGTTLKELFRNALVGMFQTIEPRVQGCEIKQGRLICGHLPAKRSIEVSASQQDLLLTDFLSEALYLSDHFSCR
jgi:SHS2 domain-containing protein